MGVSCVVTIEVVVVISGVLAGKSVDPDIPSASVVIVYLGVVVSETVEFEPVPPADA